MQHVEEFQPVELIIAYDIKDVPSKYIKLLQAWLKVRFNEDGPITQETWNWGTEIKIVHWEWHVEDKYHLIIDIFGLPGNYEQGIICLNNEIIFENNNQELTQIKSSPMDSRKSSFEIIRQQDSTETHPHCQKILNIFKELFVDLIQEDISDDEFDDAFFRTVASSSDSDASDSTISSDSD